MNEFVLLFFKLASWVITGIGGLFIVYAVTYMISSAWHKAKIRVYLTTEANFDGKETDKESGQ